MKKQNIIVILGQTATGKSDLAVKMAERIKGLNQSKRLTARTSLHEVLGEIISADSRQVYTGLDIGTGKITKKEMKGIPHHLLSVADPKKQFTVEKYQKLANQKIKEILSKGHVPIVCGGTGFYIDALINGTIFPEVKPDNKLRKELEKKSVNELFKILLKLDKNRAKEIKDKNELNNKVRLIRAIEIAKALGKVPKIIKNKPPYKFIKIGLFAEDEILKEKIQKRLLKRIKSGMLFEAKKLHQNGLSWKRMNELGLEYRYMALYLQKKINKKEMLGKLNSEIFHYAKRQMTWFKKDKTIKWFSSGKIKAMQIIDKELF